LGRDVAGQARASRPTRAQNVDDEEVTRCYAATFAVYETQSATKPDPKVEIPEPRA
jgi:hypothetical protein